MIQLTKDFAMTADQHCYMVGKLRVSRGKHGALREPTYYSTAAQAVQGALSRVMRQGVADESITSLRQFIEEQRRLKAELQTLIEPLE